MKENAFFIGGAKGVGKSSVLRTLGEYVNLEIVNTGDFFNRANKMYERSVAKKLAKQELINYIINKSPLIADTHYAGFLNGIYSGMFERGLYPDELEQLANSVNLELILVEADPQLVYERRLKDKTKGVDRDLVLENIKKEIDANRKYFEEYCQQLNKEGYVVKNVDFDDTVDKLYKIITSLYH